MSATTESLLIQIIELENRINEARSRGEDCLQLEETLSNLRSRFATMSEALVRTQGILKG